MRQYWINFRGEQQGPMSIEQLSQMGLDETAYVWHSGLPDWVKITSVPELNEMLTNSSAEPQEAPELPQQPTEAQGADTMDADRQEVPDLDTVDNSYMMDTPPQQVVMPQQAAATQEPAAECPPTNLVWAIIATILCCSIPGILGIVFAILTKKYYREGNLLKAQRMSDYGAWSVIASIMLGIISMPLSCAMNIAKMAM